MGCRSGCIKVVGKRDDGTHECEYGNSECQQSIGSETDRVHLQLIFLNSYGRSALSASVLSVLPFFLFFFFFSFSLQRGWQEVNPRAQISILTQNRGNLEQALVSNNLGSQSKYRSGKTQGTLHVSVLYTSTKTEIKQYHFQEKN